MNYFICGFTGAGKSFLLKQIENSYKLTHYQFIDLDFHIDQKYATEYDSLGQMIETIGLEKFRELEKIEIEALNSGNHIFVALGGGALNESTLPLFSDPLFTDSWQGLWLDTDFEKCFKRIKDDENRPLVKLGEQKLRELYIERVKLYSKYTKIQNLSQVLEIVKS